MKALESGSIGKINAILNTKVSYDITFWGSSTTLVHVIPKEVDSILGIESYNYGLDGTNFQQYSGLLRTYANYAGPSVVVIGINITTFHPRSELYFPEHYVNAIGNEVVRSALNSIDPWTTTKMYWIPLYDLTLFDDKLYYQILNPAESNLISKGFQAHHGLEFLQPGPIPYDSIEISRPYVDHLYGVLDELRIKGHKPVIIVSPLYREGLKEIKNISDFNAILYELGQKKIPVFNYLNSDLCINKDLFYNYMHLNIKGAKLHSQELAYDLKPLFRSFNQ
ncbi:MAG: hypothetical protein K9J17_17490 [Flavobacteriales bacterium]|nr:hypothetical protein [Flavobacteriales bacterium]